jgi:hypothetical protein
MRDGTRIHERLVRNHGHSAGRSPIHISDGLHVPIVEDIDDRRPVHDCVGHVDVGDVSLANSITGHKNFARAKREPADTVSPAESDRETKTASTYPGDEC